MMKHDNYVTKCLRVFIYILLFCATISLLLISKSVFFQIMLGGSIVSLGFFSIVYILFRFTILGERQYARYFDPKWWLSGCNLDDK